MSLDCQYKDNGIGFELNNYFNAPSKGMGLTNIKSRIQSLGGRLDMTTSPGNGFELLLSLKTAAANYDK